MVCSAEPTPDDIRADLLYQLGRRLEVAYDLAFSVRRHLLSGDVAQIEEATARLETLAQEFKLLAEEHDRLPSPSDRPSERLLREREILSTIAMRIARSSAVTGGLLERMVRVSRRLLGLLGAAKEGVYHPTGRTTELIPSGVRLKEWV